MMTALAKLTVRPLASVTLPSSCIVRRRAINQNKWLCLRRGQQMQMNGSAEAPLINSICCSSAQIMSIKQGSSWRA